ncbi:hypothetical protein AVEN_9778-1 [Araneus ventricosus]|uniref:Transposable element P transposase-like RNase H domain-containing protein n=1 Tax=Araneus ventricosus TaxID=182803 RepID=A0A4Y2EQV9_ARAVE|nr:hypothetical protein AVEN_9778-1 [Araneus ventricosus]
MSESDRLCVLTIDEMSIKPGLKYTTDIDSVDGFTTVKKHAFKEDPPFATQALILGYHFTSSSEDYSLSELIHEAIDILQSCELEVVSVVCDQENVCLSKISKETHRNVGSQKMNVKLAAQVPLGSHSVTAALNLYVKARDIDNKASETPEFVYKMDKIFDSVNARSLKHQKKEMCAVTENSGHVELWKKTIP